MGNGARTHDTRNHNPVLCQLSYTHHMELLLTGRRRLELLLWTVIRLRRTTYGSPQDCLARLKGLEPLAHCLEGSCSIHLSYRRVWSG